MTGDEIDQIRTRLHKVADEVQDHEGTLIEHKTIIAMLAQELKNLRNECATREGMSDAFRVVATQMESAAKETSLKIGQVEDKLTPIQRGIYWVVGLIVAAVIVALLGLVVQTAK